MNQRSAVHTLTPCHVGQCRLGKNHVLGDPWSDEDRIDFVLYAYLVECGDGEVDLIDLGPKTLDYTNRMFRRYGFFRETGEDDVVQPHGNLLDHLARRGHRPEDVRRVIYTHLHADHHGMDVPENAGMNEDFPNAEFVVSRKGWDFNLGERKEGHWNSYLDWSFGDFLLRCEEEGRFLAVDDAELRPGIRTVYLGGHSVCGQAVVVETSHGPAVVTSDEIYQWDLLEKGVIGRLHTTPEAMLAATETLVRMAEEDGAILLPCHEPDLWPLYVEHGGDWLAAARERTVIACQGYRNAAKTMLRS